MLEQDLPYLFGSTRSATKHKKKLKKKGMLKIPEPRLENILSLINMVLSGKLVTEVLDEVTTTLAVPTKPLGMGIVRRKRKRDIENCPYRK